MLYNGELVLSLDAFGEALSASAGAATELASSSTLEALIPRLGDFHNVLLHPPQVSPAPLPTGEPCPLPHR